MARKPGIEYYKKGDYLQAYLKPRRLKLFIAYAFNNQDSRSATANYIFGVFFGNLSEKEINKLLALYEKMSPEERRNPGKRGV